MNNNNSPYLTNYQNGPVFCIDWKTWDSLSPEVRAKTEEDFEKLVTQIALRRLTTKENSITVTG